MLGLGDSIHVHFRHQPVLQLLSGFPFKNFKNRSHGFWFGDFGQVAPEKSRTSIFKFIFLSLKQGAFLTIQAVHIACLGIIPENQSKILRIFHPC